MKVFSFICRSANEALAQIHAELGPDAMVLNVRPIPRKALARLWSKGREVEVLACVPEEDDRVASSSLADGSGMASVAARLFSVSGPGAPLQDATGRPHVFIGPPGTGKTTLLCKWMTRSVLQNQSRAGVWRLDGVTANTAEFLNVYCEMLGLAVQRYWDPAVSPSSQSQVADDLALIDIPGVAARDGAGLRELQTHLAGFGHPRLHLVLNAAYDLEVLREQFQAFAAFGLEDVSLCHLDEARDIDRLGEFLKGTNCSLRFIATGQKVPGDLTLRDEVPASLALVAG